MYLSAKKQVFICKAKYLCSFLQLIWGVWVISSLHIVLSFFGCTQPQLRTYIECDRIATSAPMERADQAARAGGRVSTWIVTLSHSI